MVDVKTKIAELEIIAGSPVICVESTAFLTVLKLRDIPSYYVYDKEMELVGVFSHYNTTSTTRYRVVGVGQGIFGVINRRGNLVIPMEFKCLKPLDKNGLYWRFSRDMREDADGDMWACRNKGKGYDIVRCKITNNEIVILEDLMGEDLNKFKR